MKQIIAYTTLALLLTACGATPVADTIDNARRDIDNGNADRAADAITEMVESADAIAPDRLLDVSILLIKAAEETGNEEYIAQATRCYRKAFALDSAAAAAYIDTLPTDDTPRAALLEQLRLSLPQ